MKNVDEIASKYGEPLDKRIIEFLELVTIAVEERDISAYSKIILKMLIPQLVIYYKALDIMQQNKDVAHQDVYNRISKAPEIQVMQKANDQILNLLDKLALSPWEKAKIKRINKDDGETANELLASLIS